MSELVLKSAQKLPLSPYSCVCSLLVTILCVRDISMIPSAIHQLTSDISKAFTTVLYYGRYAMTVHYNLSIQYHHSITIPSNSLLEILKLPCNL